MPFLNRNIFVLSIILFFAYCKPKPDDGKFHAVTTTTMITDLVKVIGGDSVIVDGLMGAGVDPHLYKASEGDVTILTNADVIFYNGLHLEGKMTEVFEKMSKSQMPAFAISSGIPSSHLISSSNFAGNYDPHIWFSIENWKSAAIFVCGKLSALKPYAKNYFEKNLQAYLLELENLQAQLSALVQKVPREKRILVTAHDAFVYFRKEFEFEVVGLQGISTASEAGTKDLLDLANFISERNIPAIFIESSVPQQTILALQKAVQSKKKNVKIGGTLYADALGNPNTPEGSYIGMYQYNMKTIINALNE